MPVNLPPVPRRSKPAVQAWNVGEWYFSAHDVKRFTDMGLSETDIAEITRYISRKPLGFSLSDYMYKASLAGVDPSNFLDIARSGALESPPVLTKLRQYLGATNQNATLAMLAMRAGLSAFELQTLANDEELTEENLRAMIDLS